MVDLPFLMPIEDVFSISGRGTVVTGRIERGVINVGGEVEIVGIRDTRKSVCTGVEMFRKLLDRGEAGDNVGVLLRGIDREGVERGQVLCKLDRSVRSAETIGPRADHTEYRSGRAGPPPSPQALCRRTDLGRLPGIARNP